MHLYSDIRVFRISDPPGPPVDVSADGITVDSCVISWAEPENDGGSPITGYYVEKFTGSRWTKVNKKPTKKMELPINDLMEKSDYEFRVCAENEAGVGKPSETTGRFIAKNPFDVPGKPDAPIIDEITAEDAQISWSAPKDDGGAEITKYNLEMRQTGDIKWKPAAKVKDTNTKVDGLREGAEYEFRVTAENKAGAGPASDPTKAKYGEPPISM